MLVKLTTELEQQNEELTLPVSDLKK